MVGWIDRLGVIRNRLVVIGWAIGDTLEDFIEVWLENAAHYTVNFDLSRYSRQDVASIYFGKSSPGRHGFQIQVPLTEGDVFYLCMGRDKNAPEKRVRLIPHRIMHGRPFTLRERSAMRLESKKIGQALERKNKQQELTDPYEQWFNRHRAGSEALNTQRQAHFPYEPKISIIVPVFRTPVNFLKDMINSCLEQSYANWELCLAEASALGDKPNKVLDVIREYAAKDERVRYTVLKENLGISGNTNAALGLAAGEYIALLDHDDMLGPEALFEVVKALNGGDGEPGFVRPDVVYTDEDKITADGSRHFQPNIKPDFDIFMLRNNNYICHLFVARKELALRDGGFRSEYDGSQDYDFILRCTESAGRICHIPKVLYYWRSHGGSVAENPEGKMYAFEAGRKAIAGNLERTKTAGEVTLVGAAGIYRVKYGVMEPELTEDSENQPQQQKSMLLVISNEKKALKRWIPECTDAQDIGFLSVQELLAWANGDQFDKERVLLFADGNLIPKTEGWLTEITGLLESSGVGAVGGKLINDKGIILSMGKKKAGSGSFEELYKGLCEEDTGELSRAVLQQQADSLPDECFLIKAGLWLKYAKGETRADIVCEALRKEGYKILVTPYAVFELNPLAADESFELDKKDKVIIQELEVPIVDLTGSVIKLLRYFKHHGFSQCVKKVKAKVFKLDKKHYTKWREALAATPKTLSKQNKLAVKFESQPKISLVVPLYATQTEYLKALIESVKNQSYTNWELCLADGTEYEEKQETLWDKVIAVYAANDERIRYRKLDKNYGIAGNTNAALEMSGGEILAFADHDDVLEPDAFYWIIKALNIDKDAGIFYTDEDKIDGAGNYYSEPNLKPDFNIDFIRSVNYICHLFAVNRSVYETAGGMRDEFEGAQDYDFILRCIDTGSKVNHIPRILYHWRSHESSTSMNPESKSYAFEAGIKAIEEHLKRQSIDAEVFAGDYPGLYRVKYKLAGNPLISVIIPNKDHIKDLDLCISSIEERSSYRNFEFVIIENNSTEPETFEYYELIKKRPNVKVAVWDGPFNYSAINNYGVGFAEGEYLLFLNNDTEIIEKECLEEMLSLCMRPEVGIVGAKLLYGDRIIQHAGVVVGFGGIAGHAFVGMHETEKTYQHRTLVLNDYTAVTAACMMSPAKVFKEVEGFDENLAVAFNDTDYCMKVHAAGFLAVYTPYARLFHYESRSRGYEDTPEKVARFEREKGEFQQKWPEMLEKGDPAYNVNLTMNKSNFELRDLVDEPVNKSPRIINFW